jgi:hypothetical protein
MNEKAQQLPWAMWTALRPAISMLFGLNSEISALDKAIRKVHQADATSRRLLGLECPYGISVRLWPPGFVDQGTIKDIGM